MRNSQGFRIINSNVTSGARERNRFCKMTLTVDAAGAAFYSSTTTVSVKRLAAVLQRRFLDREPALYTIIYNAKTLTIQIDKNHLLPKLHNYDIKKTYLIYQGG